MKRNKPIEDESANESQGESVHLSDSDYKIDNEVENGIWKKVNLEELNNMGLDDQKMTVELRTQGARAK